MPYFFPSHIPDILLPAAPFSVVLDNAGASVNLRLAIGETILTLAQLYMRDGTGNELISLEQNGNIATLKEANPADPEFAARSHKRNSDFQFWTHENHAIEIRSPQFTRQKLDYIHNNPVRAGWVAEPWEWLYYSATHYCGKLSLIEVDFVH